MWPSPSAEPLNGTDDERSVGLERWSAQCHAHSCGTDSGDCVVAESDSCLTFNAQSTVRVIGPHEDHLTIVKRRKLKWYGRVSRSTCLARTILQGT